MSQAILLDLLIILSVGFTAGIVCKAARIPLLVGYILVGAVIGEGGLGWIIAEHRHGIEYFAEIGVLLLLFSVGLEFSLEELAKLRRHILLGGSAQMCMVAVPAAAASMVMGVGWRSAILLGVAIALSSTVLVFRALSEYGQVASPAGRRAVGILLFQDIAIVPVLLLVPLLTGLGRDKSVVDYIFLLFNSSLLVVVIPLLRKVLQRWIAPWLSKTRSPELIVLFVVSLLGLLMLAAYAAGLPVPLGAFAAGLVLNGNRLTSQIDALLLSFREVFAAIFFVSLGMLFQPDIFFQAPRVAALGFIAILILKFFAGSYAVRLTGMTWSTSLGVGIGLSQIGEFAFVLVFAGVKAGLISETNYDYVLVFALGSLILTPLMLKIGLGWAGSGKLSASRYEQPAAERIPEDLSTAVVIGIGEIGRHISLLLETRGVYVCAVDLSTVNLHSLAQQGMATVVGEAQDPDTLKRARIESMQVAIVCVPDDQRAVEIVRAICRSNPECIVLVRCRYRLTTQPLKNAGAHIVITEEAETAKAFIDILTEKEII